MTIVVGRSSSARPVGTGSPLAWPRPVRWSVAFFACVALTCGAVRLVQARIIEVLEAEAIEPKPNGTDTPARHGAASQDLPIDAPGRRLQGRIVRAADPRAPAVMIFHGNGEALSDWADVQAMLYRAGVTSMVFDYGGFGNSDGKPSVSHMREDGLAAYAALVRLTPGSARRVLIGHSLGNAVMLDAARLMQPQPAGMVVHAGFTSAREIAVRMGLVSPLVARLLPDLWDNEASLSLAGVPVLVVHGADDDVIPWAMGQRLARAAGAHAVAFRKVPGAGHDGIYLHPAPAEWDPIVAFVRPPDRAARAAP